MPPPLHEPSADMAVETPTPSSISELGLAKTELVYFGNEFPNGLQEIVRRLSNHAKDRHYQVLAELIANATLVVKDEIRQLPTDLKELFSPFTSILSWVDDVQLREGRLCGSVDGALLVVVQLAAYIGYLVTNPDELHNFEEMSLAGLGVGLLASTAVSLSWTLADLPLAGADAVRLAFRMGVLVASVSETLDCRDLSQAPDTWAYVVLNVSPVDAQRELDAIQPQQHVPSASKVFISAISPTSITISGPPAKLKTLLKESEFYRVSKFVPLPVYGGLCHAPHVYGLQHVTSIVHGSSLNMLRKDSWPIVPVYSTSTGLPYVAKNAAELFECVVMELLTKPICWDQVIRGMVDRLKGTGTAAVALYCFGNSTPLNALSTSLTSEVKGLQASINSLLPWITQRVPSDTTPRDTSQSKLAIVGMSCRLPGGADSTEKFWKVLEDGLDVSRRIPPDRFDVDSHYDPTGSGKELNKSMTQYGCFIDEPGLFDAPFFNMSPRESLVVDPQMRLALVTAYEALEQSGFVLNRTPSTQSQRIGTYYGQAADDYREVNQGQRVSTYYIPGGCRAFGPGRINYFFRFAGPSYSIDTACSSGLAAIEVACQALWNGDIDTAVAGGVNVLTNPDGFAGLSHGHFLTKGHNACKTWDITADGYCRADGIGSVVIKRYEEAIADNDAILGVILGAGTNHSADAVSITHPHAGHQAYLSRQVLRQSGVNPLDVSYIELHGTGTQAGDLQEMQAVTDVYAPSVGGRNSGQPLYIGAVKSNIGHGESVAGTAALIKVLMMLQKNAIPPHVGIKTEINPKLPKDLGTRNVHIPHKLTPWPRAPGKKRMVAINNFGAAGGNTTLVLEEAPTRHITETDPRQTHVVSVSAKTKVSLAANIENLLEYLDANPETSLADLSYTTTARRYHHSLRVASASSSIVNLRKQLMGHLEKVNSTRPSAKSDSPPIAFAFTGQGASLKSMDLELYRDATSFREHIQYLDSLAQAQGYPSFIPALDGSHPPDYKQPPVITQLALVCTEISLAKYWSTLGIKPDVVMGHSLGEFAAMNVAGVTSASETIFMVGRRAELLQEKCTRGSHCMMAVRASVARISECAAGKPYTVACINSASDTVLSGTQKQINDVAMLLEAAGLKCIRLDVSFAFHSDQVNPVLDEFENAVKLGVTFQEPKLPIISPLLGKVIFDGKTLNANYVRRATREAVDFLAALENAQRVATIDDETVWLEIGPHPVCTGFIKTIIPSTQLALPSICRGSDNWQTVAESLAALHLAGVKVGWNEFHRPFEGRLRLLDLPAYVWNNKNYWVQYNGDWCLTKGNSFYVSQQKASRAPQTSEIQTSTVQQIWEESFNGVAGTVTIQSDLMQPDFCAAADGHRLNNCGVVTSSIHADIAYTLGGYLHKKLCPQTNSISMDITNLAVTKGLVANSTKSSPQLIRVTATTADVYNGVDLYWQSVGNDCTVHDSFASARIVYGDANKWLCSWSPIAHLIVDRIETLERLASVGKANRFSRNMAYTLFASNLVDYADKYRGMQSVVMHDLEGFADVQLTTKEGGVWTVPPYFIDSVAHLAGFIMNCSDAMDSKKNFCVTPGWKSMRFAKPLVPGAQYRSYVKMIPTVEDPTTYFGDVYILQHNVVVGMVNGIEFHSYPRILLNRFFSPADKITSTEVTPSPPEQAQQTKPTNGCMQSQPTSASSPAAAPVPPSSATPVPVDATTPPAAPPTSSDGIAAKALQLIAHEAGLAVSDLNDDASFVSLGIDSLMSLVIAENLGSELNVKVSGSLFIDYPSIGDLRKWLEEYHS